MTASRLSAVETAVEDIPVRRVIAAESSSVPGFTSTFQWVRNSSLVRGGRARMECGWGIGRCLIGFRCGLGGEVQEAPCELDDLTKGLTFLHGGGYIEHDKAVHF